VQTVSQSQRLGGALWFAALAGIASVVTAGLYVFGTEHVPDYTTGLFGATGEDTLPLKSWMATGVLTFAGVQLVLALWMYGRLPRVAPGSRAATIHRLFGVAAILLTLPIAYHCILAYGVQTEIDTRIEVHSLAGCFLYGAIAAKLLIVRSRRFPGWTLPLAGGTLVTVIAILWYTSALWYFDDFSLPSL
jgi:Family of unknown function (DUF6529)